VGRIGLKVGAPYSISKSKKRLTAKGAKGREGKIGFLRVLCGKKDFFFGCRYVECKLDLALSDSGFWPPCPRA